MNKIFLVVRREYLSRVRKKSFIIMTILAPLLLAGMVLIPTWLMTRDDSPERKIAVVGEGAGLFYKDIASTKSIKFDYLPETSPEEIKKTYEELGYYGFLVISPKVVYIPNAIRFYSRKQPNMEMLMHISNELKNEIEKRKLETFNIENIEEILKEVESDVKVQTILISDEGEEKKTSTGLSMGIAYASGLLIYMLTFIFGAQVMRGVIEEKTSRIVEVLISSLKPFQLMMGKILGIALVGLTQFFLWIVLTLIIVTIAQSVFLPDISPMAGQQAVQSIMAGENAQAELNIQQAATGAELNEAQAIFESLKAINWPLILGSFIIFFLGGYLLYSALFAAVGSAVDNETDTQQFMMPITIPLLLGLFISMSAFQNPDSNLVFWFSFIPFTSPMVMMARLPFGVPGIELLISMAILILSFLATTWLAAKIYRTGILMYGKKVSYREIFKWLKN